MKALVFDIRVNSLYSVRIPFTWQSALTYPVLPPSAVIGMLANALQRFRNDRHPLAYLELIESDLIWVGSRLLTPCVIKSYTTSAIVKWQVRVGDKSTNALGRQFAFAKDLQVAAIFNNDTLINDIAVAVKTSPLTCGDSESPISLENPPIISDAKKVSSPTRIKTEFPIPFSQSTRIIVDEENNSNGRVYLMHERCMKKGKDFPMFSYMVPVREEQKILKPSSLTVEVSGEIVYEIQRFGCVIAKGVKN